MLSGRVDQTESGLSSANSSITALNSSVRAGNATSGDLISNPTFDPEFSQMGFTVVSSSSEGVPANCPYAYVARIAARDHHPNFAAIPATLGMSMKCLLSSRVVPAPLISTCISEPQQGQAAAWARLCHPAETARRRPHGSE